MRKLLCLLFLLLNVHISKSQGIYNNGANIVISSGTDLYVDGDNSGDYFTTSNGEIDVKNTAELFIEGDWTNNNGSDNAITSTTATGWVRFEGNSAALQTLGGNAATTFSYLEFNNANGFTLNQNALSPGKLELTSGVVSTGANYLIHSSLVAADLITYSSSAFVNGNYRRYFGQNTNTYAFPVGDGTASTNYKRYDLVNNNLDLSGADYLTVSVETITEGANETDTRFETVGLETCVSTPLNQIHSGAVWTATPQSSTVNGGDYGVHLYLENVGDGLTSNSLDNQFTVVKRTTGSTDYAAWESVTCVQGTTIPANGAAGRVWNGGNGYAEKIGLSSFSEFAVASASFVLPVELSDWKSRCEDNQVRLYWQTQSEENLDYFEIERSLNGYNYEVIKKIAAQGNVNLITNYFETDDYSMDVYYRLKSVNFDGYFEYSTPIYQSACSLNTDWITVESIDNGNLTIRSSLQSSEQFQIILVDALGKVLFTRTDWVDSGMTSLSISCSHIATGTYFLSCIGNQGTVHTQKLFVH
ncbi:hypothetical protein N9R81_03570 [Flavobacteriales bacterium]|nr:hypothetical protein [Flavobacteriales bacterium]